MFLVLWDPPINKGTCGTVFATEEEAKKFVELNLAPPGWPTNIRVWPLDRAKALGWRPDNGLVPNTYRKHLFAFNVEYNCFMEVAPM